MFEKMDSRLFEAHIIGKEFGINPYEIDENWGDVQMAQTMAFLYEINKKINK